MATAKLAWEFLEGEGYMPADAQGNKVSLAHSLLLLAHCAPASVLHKGVRAVATLLEHEEASKTGDVVALAVARRVDPLVDMMEHSAKMVQDAVTGTREVATMVYNTWEEVRDEMQKVADATKEELARTVEETREEICKVIREAGGSFAADGEWDDSGMAEGRTTTGRPMSYAAALNSSLPSTHPSTLARTRLRERQVLIDRDPQADSNHLDALNERELVDKANEAISGLKGHAGAVADKARALGAKRLRNGGVVYEFDSPETATWLRRDRTAFTEKFGGMSIVRDKAIPILVEYVPTSHSTDALAENGKIERDSGIGEGTLLSTRWIKPVHRRAAGQHMAHLIV